MEMFASEMLVCFVEFAHTAGFTTEQIVRIVEKPWKWEWEGQFVWNVSTGEHAYDCTDTLAGWFVARDINKLMEKYPDSTRLARVVANVLRQYN